MANKNKVGLVFASMFGGMHFTWSILVALGWAQSIWNFISWAHMIHTGFIIGPFSVASAATIVIFSSTFGYILGFLGALVWNKVHHA